MLKNCDPKIKELIERHIEFAKNTLIELKHFQPMALGINALEGKSYVFLLLWDSVKEKYNMINQLKKSAFELGITRWLFMSEAWIKTCKKDETIDPSRAVSTYADRKECIIISSYGLLEKGIMASFVFEKVNDDIIFEETIWLTIGDQWTDNLWGDAFNESWFHQKKKGN